MPCKRFHLSAILACLVALVGCVEGTSPTAGSGPVAANAEIARLKALGFRTTAGTTGGTQVLNYSGPVTRAILCRSASGPYAPIAPRRTTAGGGREEVTLDAYLQLTPGQDGVLSRGERSGVYAVTILNRAPGSRAVQRLERITFGPSGAASTKTGLTCRAA